MSRVYNFSPGPAMIPEEVLQQAKDELLDWRGMGVSVMEISHRSPEFIGLAAEVEQQLRDIIGIPTNYKVLFMAGGATAQFGMVPMNLLQGKKNADYIHTGNWGEKALNEAKRYCDVNIAFSAKENGFTAIAPQSEWNLNKDAAYVHYTPNETVMGLEFQWDPETGDVPLVADMTSYIVSRPMDINHFDLIYASSQKNLGQVGITIVIIREDLIRDPLPGTPTMFTYKTYAENNSLYNTPPTYSWYFMGLVLQWIKKIGGIEAMGKLNHTKSEKLYNFIDDSGFYNNHVDKSSRSWMNIPFSLKDEKLNQAFIDGAKEIGLVGLKGHRLVGGMRASIYNAMPEKGVDKLIEFMKDFEKRNG